MPIVLNFRRNFIFRFPFPYLFSLMVTIKLYASNSQRRRKVSNGITHLSVNYADLNLHHKLCMHHRRKYSNLVFFSLQLHTICHPFSRKNSTRLNELIVFARIIIHVTKVKYLFLYMSPLASM